MWDVHQNHERRCDVVWEGRESGEGRGKFFDRLRKRLTVKKLSSFLIRYHEGQHAGGRNGGKF